MFEPSEAARYPLPEAIRKSDIALYAPDPFVNVGEPETECASSAGYRDFHADNV
jgi:hypothetical protein